MHPRRSPNRVVLVLFLLTLAIPAVRSDAAVITFNSEAAWQAAVGPATALDFDAIAPGASVQFQYPGVEFGGVFGSPNPVTTNIFSHSPSISLMGVPSLGAGGGGFTLFSASLLDGFGLWTYDLQFPGTEIRLINSSFQIIQSFDLFTTGGGHGAFSWGFNGFQSTNNDIATIMIIVAGNDFVTFDDMQLSPVGGGGRNSPVPEPATITMMALGLGTLARRRARRWINRSVRPELRARAR